MRILVMTIVLLVVSVATSCLSFAQTKAPQTKVPAATPQGDVLVGEDVWYLLADEPDTHFKEAHELFLEKDLKGAATDIRKGAAFIKIESARAEGGSKQALRKSAEGLDKLADDLDKGVVRSVDDLKLAFAQADHDLAVHHHLKASELWAKKETKAAGRELLAAADAIERAVEWTGQKAEAGSKDVMARSRAAGEKLTRGVEWTTAEVETGMKDTASEIEKLGKQLGQKKPEKQ